MVASPDYSYGANNPLSYIDENGLWIGDIVFLAIDIKTFIQNPSVVSAGFVVLSVVSTSIPVGSISAIAHYGKIASKVKIKEAIRKIGKFCKVSFKPLFKGTGKLLSRSKSDFSHMKDVKQIEKMFGLKKNSFHPSGADGIKVDIIEDFVKKFPNDAKKIGRNPDLAFAKDGQIMVISRTNKGKSFVTDLNINNYK